MNPTNTPTLSPHPPAVLNLLWGIRDIGAVIERTPRQTHYLLSKGELPARKIGGRWCAPRDDLKAFFAQSRA